MKCQMGSPCGLAQMPEPFSIPRKSVAWKLGWRAGPGQANVQNTKLRNVQLKSSSNGTGATLSYGGEDDYMDMVIADMDFHRPSPQDNVMRVPNPNGAGQYNSYSPRNQVGGGTARRDWAKQMQMTPPSDRALKIENAWGATELKSRNRQLAQAQQELMVKDEEISQLKRQLASRDQQLQYTKAELIESRQLVQKKDDQLRQTYESLVTSARERSNLREELIAVEKELMDVRSELHDWTTKLVDLKTVMDGIDEDDDDIDLGDKYLMDKDPKEQNFDFSHSYRPKPQEQYQPSQRITSAVDLLKDLQNLSEQLVSDVQDDENTFNMMGH